MKEHDNIIYLLESEKFYTTLKEKGIENQLKLLETRTKIFSVCKNYSSRFETLEMIKHEKKKMFIERNVSDSFIKIYKPSGKEKEGDKIEIKVNDILLTRCEKNTKYTFDLYRIISKHSKHQSVKILWTEIEKGAQSNFYVDKLDEMYQNIIKENVS